MLSNLRQQIAEEAAKIMIENGERDYHAAKLKAAKQIVVYDQTDLPSNQEIEEHIKKRQAIFGASQQQELIRSKRLEAQKAMNFFKDFNPCLTGPVLDGTASRYSPIEIHLFVDAMEEVTIFLMDHDVPFQLSDRRMKLGKNEEITVPVFSFFANDQEVEVSAFSPKYKSHSPLSPIDGAPQKRANLKKLQKLLENDQGNLS